MFDETPQCSEAYEIVRQRLHLARLRTVVIPAHPELTAKSAVDILDRLRITSGILVGDRAGGELAWDVAAAEQERFTGLVAIDVGHPRVPDAQRMVRDEDCPAVHVDTTVLVSTRAAHGRARASRRYVQGEFRLVELAGPRKSGHFATQLATEIVLRSFSR